MMIQVRVRADGIAAIVRKTVLDENGLVVAKYGLSVLTGEWVKVPEATRYPDECILPITER
jgi:hypothetical protein